MSGVVVWLTGLPASGKSTLARSVVAELKLRDIPAIVLDSDDVRAALVPHPGYDEASREHFYQTLGNLAALVARQGHVVLVPATAHRRAFRDEARRLAPLFLEVFVDTPLDECRRRDPKGLYASNTAAVPGVGTVYEPPLHPELTVVPTDEDAATVIAARVAALTP